MEKHKEDHLRNERPPHEKQNDDKLKQNRPQVMMKGPGPGMRGMPVQKAKDSKKTIKKLINYFKDSKKLILILFIIMIPIALLSIGIPIVQGKVIDAITLQSNNINLLLVIMLGCALTHCVLTYSQGYISAFLTVKIVKKMRNELFKKIVSLPVKYIDSHPHGDIMSRMTNDVDTVSNTISSSLVSILSGIILITGTVIAMFIISWQLTLLSFISIVVSLFLVTNLSKAMRKHYKQRQIYLGKVNSIGEEMITGYRTVSAYSYQKVAIEEFNEYSDNLKKHGIKSDILGGLIPPLMGVANNIGYVLLAVFGGVLASGNNPVITIGSITTFVVLSKQFSRPINEIAALWGQIQSAIAAAERVFELHEEKEEIDLGNKNFDFKDLNISFENVDFSYVEGKQVLTNFNLKVKKGQKIALVGATGSGKTTVVNLLMRFYDINKGSIKIDGVDIKDIKTDELRKNIGIVLQDTVLFKDTMKNNINYSNKNASNEEIINASVISNSDYFISKFPKKYETMCSAGGANLSQGQRQLLTIARAVLADPKILILDEATSSVDTRTEKHIQDAMNKLMKDRTSLIIAHRLSTIVDSDLIVVLDQGKILETGNHEELLANKGKYFELYETQFKGQTI